MALRSWDLARRAPSACRVHSVFTSDVYMLPSSNLIMRVLPAESSLQARDWAHMLFVNCIHLLHAESQLTYQCASMGDSGRASCVMHVLALMMG